MIGKLYHNEHWLREQYITLQKGCPEIARECGCSGPTIRYFLIKFEIPIRSKIEAQRTLNYINHMSEVLSGPKNPRYGKNVSEDTRRKIASKAIGRGHSWGTRKKLALISGQRKHSDEERRKISERNKGRIIPEEQRIKIANTLKGRYPGNKNPNWRGGASFEPYCPAFNRALKEEIRETFGRKCYLCGKKENGRGLDIHHCDYNKGQGCGQRWSLIPLCKSCHTKTNFNRHHWFNLLSNYWINNHFNGGMIWDF